MVKNLWVRLLGRLRKFAIYPRHNDKLNDEDVISIPESNDLQGQSLFKFWGVLSSRAKKPLFRKDKNSDAQSSVDDSSHWTDGLSLRAKAFAAIALINMIFIVVAIGLSRKYGDDRGFLNGAVIYEGSCALTERWSTALHLIINILSTCMLVMSTYCMQVLAAPTRQDIDKQHAEKRWLDIGYLSWRNIMVLDKYRLSLLAILAMTAAPFHLMYNSIIFESLATNEFAFVLGPGDLSSDNIQNLTTPELEQCFRPPISNSFDPTTWQEFSSAIAAGNFDRLSTEKCFAFLEKLNPSGVTVLVGLVDEISAADGGNAAFLMTDLYGGSPDLKFMTFNGETPNKTTGEVRGDVFSRQTFSLGIPTENGTSTLYYNAWNHGSTRDCWERGGNRAACVAGPSALGKFYGTEPWQFPTRQELEKRLHQHVLNGDEDGINKIQINTTLHCVPNAPNPEDLYNATAHKINGCLAVKTDENCKLLYSPPICIIIIFSMMAKLAVIALTLRDGRSREAPLLTIGDAIASFMKCPDSTTEGFCWSSGSDFRRGKWKTPKAPGWVQDSTANPSFPDMQPNHKIITFGHLQKPQRWMKVPSLMQWLATLSLCIACIISGSWFLERAMSSPWDYEKPNVNPGRWLTTQMLQEWWDTETRIGQLRRITWKERDERSVLSLVVVANLPQLAITTAYYFYSGISTAILAAAEYSYYGATQMPLRVSSPVESSEQISEYFFNMPYRYGIPMNLLSITLHWLVSKSLYYVSIIPYGPGGQAGDRNGEKFLTDTSSDFSLAYASSLVYSPFFIFVSLLVLGLMVCILLVLSLRRLNSEIPIARSCSAVISAACHPPKHEDCESAILGKLKWGETTQPAWDLDWFDVTIEDDKGHCSFSSWHVESPSFQKMYA